MRGEGIVGSSRRPGDEGVGVPLPSEEGATCNVFKDFYLRILVYLVIHDSG